MFETGIGVEDCQALKLILSSFTSLMVLDISGNDLPLEAVELIMDSTTPHRLLTVFSREHQLSGFNANDKPDPFLSCFKVMQQRGKMLVREYSSYK